MDWKGKPLKVNPESPFEGDLMGRQGEIENLSTLITRINTPAVIAIDAPWGMGKSTFLEMWAAHLAVNHHTTVITFNAWSTDFVEDPLVAFLGEINDGLRGILKDKGEVQNSWETVWAAGIKVLKHSSAIAARISATTLALGAGAGPEVASGAGEVASNIASDTLDYYSKEKSDIQAFQNALKDFLDKFGGDPLVIFVDELDRCRPNYAIALLERIKHLFEIEGIVFVLALDKEQLSHSIRSVYGQEFDSRTYLSRFFDWDYALKVPEIQQFIHASIASLELHRILAARTPFNHGHEEKQRLVNILAVTSAHYRLSYREILQLLTQINLCYLSLPLKYFAAPELIGFLLAVRLKDDQAFRSFLTGMSGLYELVELAQAIRKNVNTLDTQPLASTIGYLIAVYADGGDPTKVPLIKTYEETRNNPNNKNNEIRFSDAVFSAALYAGNQRILDYGYLKDLVSFNHQFNLDWQADNG